MSLLNPELVADINTKKEKLGKQLDQEKQGGHRLNENKPRPEEENILIITNNHDKETMLCF